MGDESEFPRSGALPYLTVRGAKDAIDWYRRAFGAELVGEPIVMDDGRIGHAELAFHTGMIYLAEEFPEMGLTAPEAGATSVSLMVAVDDTDEVLSRAHDAGGTVERWISENFGRRNATLIDPFGHRWMLSGPTKGVGSETSPVAPLAPL
jgi:PhnB protein